MHDLQSAANSNIVFITVEGDDTKGKGMTARSSVSLLCHWDVCSPVTVTVVAPRLVEAKTDIYNQGRAIAGAMVLKNTPGNVLVKGGCGYVYGAEKYLLGRYCPHLLRASADIYLRTTMPKSG